MNSWFPGMLDAIFQATFLCALLTFWLCIYHGLRQNERKLWSFYLPKLITVAPIWFCAIILATWEKCNELRDPTYSHFVDAANYTVSINQRCIVLAKGGYYTNGELIIFLAEFQNGFLYHRSGVSGLFDCTDFKGLFRSQIHAVFWWVNQRPTGEKMFE